jgi:large subunit ribosomal protein L24
MARVRKGDEVAVLSGKDAGKRGKVIAVFPAQNRVVVEGVNRVKRHEKIRPSKGGRGGQEGGIMTTELAVNLSNVAPVCESCGGPSRIGYHVDPERGKVRVCTRCDSEIK